jgi:DNA polymerase-3 subunit gamma/tau
MSYVVLALKYRPQKFDELIGQDHITDILRQSIAAKRTAHSYLFSGPRGIGKTSCARILAKCLNCHEGPTETPCGQCAACKEIAKGTSLDVLEIDGASNRGIDEIRALRENVKFAANFGRYKVYIVDEVHMLTSEAFNALLKTLEEPPSHVKFIFATTEPNKVPRTIISRCQRFDFKRIPIKTIVEALNGICQKEGFQVSPEALYVIAKAAQGSLRDALSILDQLSVIAENRVDSQDVFSMLGVVQTQRLFDLTEALANKDCPSALNIIEDVIDKGKDAKQLLKDITEHFRNLMIIKIGGKSLGKLVDYPIALKEMLLQQCNRFTLKAIIKTIDILVEAQEVARITESIRMPMEVAFAKLTYKGERPAPAPAPDAQPAAQSKYGGVNRLRNEKGEVDISGRAAGPEPASAAKQNVASEEPAAAGAKARPSNTPNPAEAAGTSESPEAQDAVPSDTEDPSVPVEDPAEIHDLTLERIRELWDTLTHHISQRKMSVATYLQSANPVKFDGTKLVIGFPPKCAFHKESLETKENVRMVEDVMAGVLKRTIVISYTIVKDFVPQEETPEVKDALDIFGGEVISKWHSE